MLGNFVGLLFADGLDAQNWWVDDLGVVLRWLWGYAAKIVGVFRVGCIGAVVHVLDVEPLADLYLLFDQIEPKTQFLRVLEIYMHCPWFLMRLLIYGLQDQGMLPFGLGLTQNIVSQIIRLYFIILFILNHNLMPCSINSDVLQLPNFQIKAPALANVLNWFHFNLCDRWWLLNSFGQILNVLNESDVKKDLFLPVQSLKSQLEKGTYFAFSFLEFVQVFAIFIELYMDDVLTMIKPYVQILRTGYLATYDLFVAEVL